MAVKADMDNSSVASATYTIVSLEHAGTEADPYTVADARTAIDANTNVTGVYATGIVSEIVTAYNSQYGNISYNISADGSTTADQLEVYRGKSYNGESFTSENDIKVGDVVVVYGDLTKHNSTYEFAQNNQLVSLVRPGGTKQTVTLSFEFSEATHDISESFTGLTLTTDPTGLSVTYSSSDENVATVNATTGIVTMVGAGSTTITATFVETDDYYGTEASYTLTVTNNNAAATLPFTYDGNGTSLPDGLSQSGLGTYSSSPAMKFDSTGDELILKFNDRPGKLTFDIKGNSFSGGTFKVQTSEDGETYTDLESYTELTEVQSEEFNALGENVRYIKWIYTEKVSGNVALGNINLAAYSTAPVINAEDVSIVSDATSGEIAYTITNPASGVTLNATTDADWVSGITVTADKVTFTTTANTGAERTATFTLTYTGATDKTVTVTQAAYVAPITGDKYVKVTSTDDLTNGQYLIVYEDGSVAFNGGLETLDAVSNTIDVIINNSEIAATSATTAAEFTIDVTAGTIQSASGMYIGQTSDANGLASSAETDYTNTITFADDNADIVSSGGAYLRYNSASNQIRFRYYKSSSYTGQKAIQLYKKVAPSQSVTVTPAGYATIVAKADLDIPTGVEVFAVTVGESASSAQLTEVTGGVPAGNAVLVKASAGTYEFAYASTTPDAIAKNDLHASDGTVTGAAGNIFALAKKTQGVGFYKVGEDVTIPAGKAYLEVKTTSSDPESGVKAFYGFEDDATGIEAIDHSPLTIEGAVYNLAGQRLQKMQKGINIVNGKKIAVK